jgi:hypothetical protein
MTRLVTVGCSFTSYKWRTWADYLGHHYDGFINYGIPGTDNATIARIVTNLTEPGDTVVAMWTAYERRVLHIDYNDTYGYSANHNGLTMVYDKEYFAKYYNQYERFVATLDSLQHTYTDSKYRGYNLHNFSAFNPVRGELDSEPTASMLKISSEREFYLNNIVGPSEFEFVGKRPEGQDPHPTPAEHYAFYKDIMCPALQLTPME